MESSNRREFLHQAAALPAALAAAHNVLAAESGSSPEAGASLPRIALGKYSISRLICGSNPFNGGSHLSVFVNQEMKAYYTPEQILKTLRRCQQVGINCCRRASAGTISFVVSSTRAARCTSFRSKPETQPR